MFRGLALLLAVAILSSCATVFAKDQRLLMVTSNPPGAEIIVNGMPSGLTPTRLIVNDHERLRIAIRKPGYKGAGCYINTSVGAIWLIADLLLIYTVVPLVVDLITGDWSSLESGYCNVQLQPIQG